METHHGSSVTIRSMRVIPWATTPAHDEGTQPPSTPPRRANGYTIQTPQTITAKLPGHMVLVDVKKVGRIPDGCSCRAHSRDFDQAAPPLIPRPKSGERGTLHSAIDGDLCSVRDASGGSMNCRRFNPSCASS